MIRRNYLLRLIELFYRCQVYPCWPNISRAQNILSKPYISLSCEEHSMRSPLLWSFGTHSDVSMYALGRALASSTKCVSWNIFQPAQVRLWVLIPSQRYAWWKEPLIKRIDLNWESSGMLPWQLWMQALDWLFDV